MYKISYTDMRTQMNERTIIIIGGIAAMLLIAMIILWLLQENEELKSK